MKRILSDPGLIARAFEGDGQKKNADRIRQAAGLDTNKSDGPTKTTPGSRQVDTTQRNNDNGSGNNSQDRRRRRSLLGNAGSQRTLLGSG